MGAKLGLFWSPLLALPFCSSSSPRAVEVQPRLLPLEESRGGPPRLVPVRRGWGRMRWGWVGGGHSGLKCGFQDGGGLWRMAMTAAFVLGSASFGITGSE